MAKEMTPAKYVLWALRDRNRVNTYSYISTEVLEKHASRLPGFPGWEDTSVTTLLHDAGYEDRELIEKLPVEHSRLEQDGQSDPVTIAAYRISQPKINLVDRELDGMREHFMRINRLPHE